ncbi:DUF4905 domain-containing protein [Mucilaginibacter paludis]|uniref:DUF4905 domain-containing protein n=1 Tax=Mucilaginibacter paludis TaxID=423351 RepID=UPI0002FA76A5|nr:DUF4905 domain-containing protein [Mucilaginibacter paludis]
MKPHIHIDFAAQIWKMLIDPLQGLLFIETRDTEKRQTLFSAFYLSNGHTNFINLLCDERWLTGIEACYNGVLFLHGYESALSPAHKGLIAIDGVTGITLWSNYVDALHHVSITGPVTYHTQIQPQKLFLTDALTGATLWAYNPSIDLDLDPQIRVPHVSETIDSGFKPYIKGPLTGNIHYLEYNDFRIVSLHTLIEAQLSQVLLIIQGNNLVYEDLLIDKIQKLQPEAFIMHQNRLIYIKNKVELKVLNL